MTYKNLLVHADDTKACESRLNFAMRLAASFGAHLTGVCIDTGLRLPPAIDAEVAPGFLEKLEAERRARVQAAEDAFAKASASDDNMVATEWRVVEGLPQGVLSVHARYADLVLLGQEDDGRGQGSRNTRPDSVILACGRPVIVVPYIGAPQSTAQRVLIAWNGTREATRAVNDALPLLKAAKEVEISTVNTKRRDDKEAPMPGIDLALHLARHGVSVETHPITGDDTSVADLLLSRAADAGIDLIVMGAYGHSRLREIALGGATRELLEHMTVPVLFSH